MSYLDNALQSAAFRSALDLPKTDVGKPAEGTRFLRHGSSSGLISRSTLALLAHVLSHRPAQGTPIIQIGLCSTSQQASPIALLLAQASAALAGRTLLLELQARHFLRLPHGEPATPLPDSFMPGLHHYRLGAGASDADLIYGPAPAKALSMLAHAFRVVIVQAQGPNDAASLALAPLCCCNVLIVEAGRTPVAAVKAAVAAYDHAGGRVIGTVLTNFAEAVR